MKFTVSRGFALINNSGLRCTLPRLNYPDQLCNKLLCKKNSLGQLAGAFKCERCSQEVEVEQS